MGLPKTSIIWLNYNSMRIIDLAIESLNAISELDYPNDKYELILVDNGSTDGSFEKIKKFLEKKDNLRKKIIRLSKNLGFTGGNNIGFKARDKESKYIVLLNNDAVPFKESLQTMVEYAEQYNAGSLNGIILKYGKKNVIDTAGDFIDELLFSYNIGSGNPAPWVIKRSFYVSYTDGAYALYNIRSILRSMGEKLFFDEFFGYGDDSVLGLLLWNNNYKNIVIPVTVAVHRRGSTFGNQRKTLSSNILIERNRIALYYLTNARYKHRIGLHSMRIMSSKIHRIGVLKGIIKTHYEALRLRQALKRKYGLFIDIYKAPILKITPGEFIRYYIAGTKAKLLRHNEEKIARLIKRLEVDQKDV